MKVLWFADERSCSESLERINNNFRALAVSYGYSLDGAGNIIGKDGEGNDRLEAQRTETWDAPHYDLATKAWWIADPSDRFPQQHVEVILASVGGTAGSFDPPDEQDSAAPASPER